MKKIIVLLILLSLVMPIPVHAGMGTDLDPVEKNLIDKQKQVEKKVLEDDMSKEFRQKQAEQPIKQEAKTGDSGKSGSNWWKWALGILVVGGIAAAAGGGGGSSPASGGGSTGGTATVHW